MFKVITVCGFRCIVFVFQTPQRRANRILNSAISYSRSWSNSSLFVPMSLASSLWKTIGPAVQFPYLQYKVGMYGSSQDCYDHNRQLQVLSECPFIVSFTLYLKIYVFTSNVNLVKQDFEISLQIRMKIKVSEISE